MPIIKKSAVNLQLQSNKNFVRFALKVWKQCQWCNKFFSRRLLATCDHIIPKKHGGDDRWCNLCLSCGPCNAKHAHALIGRPPFGPPDWELVRSGEPGVPCVPVVEEVPAPPDAGFFVLWCRRADGVWRPSARGNKKYCLSSRNAYLNARGNRARGDDVQVLPEGESP